MLSEIVIRRANGPTYQIVDKLIDILRRHEDVHIICMLFPIVRIKGMCHSQGPTA